MVVPCCCFHAFFPSWMASNHLTYSLSHSTGGRVLALPVGSQRHLVTDVDGDGTNDIVLPVCRPKGTCAVASEIRLSYNRQRPLCSSDGEGGGLGCRAHDDTCVSDYGYLLDPLDCEV